MIFIIGVTVLVSIMGFKNSDLFSKLAFKPFFIVEKNEYYRFFTHGFIHADYMHLIVNMFVLYSFGESVTRLLGNYSYGFFLTLNGKAHFFLLYFSALFLSSISTFFKNRKDYYYSAIGASGAVSAIVFCFIFYEPWAKLLFFGIIPIPGIVFGGLYVAYSSFMGKKERDNINHDAHLWGALYGFAYSIIMNPEMIKVFLHKILNP